MLHKYRFLGPVPDPANRTVRGWSPGVCVSHISPRDTYDRANPGRDRVRVVASMGGTGAGRAVSPEAASPISGLRSRCGALGGEGAAAHPSQQDAWLWLRRASGAGTIPVPSWGLVFILSSKLGTIVITSSSSSSSSAAGRAFTEHLLCARHHANHPGSWQPSSSPAACNRLHCYGGNPGLEAESLARRSPSVRAWPGPSPSA